MFSTKTEKIVVSQKSFQLWKKLYHPFATKLLFNATWNPSFFAFWEPLLDWSRKKSKRLFKPLSTTVIICRQYNKLDANRDVNRKNNRSWYTKRAAKWINNVKSKEQENFCDDEAFEIEFLILLVRWLLKHQVDPKARNFWICFECWLEEGHYTSMSGHQHERLSRFFTDFTSSCILTASACEI